MKVTLTHGNIAMEIVHFSLAKPWALALMFKLTVAMYVLESGDAIPYHRCC